MLYLDYSANTPVDPRVLERFCQVENGFPGNANSHHQAGFAARREIDRAAASIADILKAEPEELVFTSGASEANNLALKGIARTSRHIGKHIISTPLELAAQEGQQRSRHVQALNQRLRRELAAFPGLCINSPAEAVAHILNISVPGMRGAEMQKALDERGICVSVKSACSSDALPSRAVFAVSRDRKRALSSWRISLSHLTSMEDIDLLLRALRDISEDIQAK